VLDAGVAGLPASVFGDGGPANKGLLLSAWNLALDKKGNLFIADKFASRVRRVTLEGIITTVAGPQIGGREPLSPGNLAVDNDGNLFIVQATCIRKVSSDGTISTVVGKPVSDYCESTGYPGEGDPLDSRLWEPSGIAVDSAGNLFVSDEAINQIRKVSRNGIITTIAGTGKEENPGAGDGGPALKAELSLPQGLAIDSAGNLFIADNLNHKIRKVSPDGIITTVAGTGSEGYSGDGGAATRAELNRPYSVAVDSTGNLYIADTLNRRIRRVSSNGTITTIAGNGEDGSYGDGGPATEAAFRAPVGVAVDSAGNVFVSDSDNKTIRILRLTGSSR
jgi:sugar lactone lactonase YvrE